MTHSELAALADRWDLRATQPYNSAPFHQGIVQTLASCANELRELAARLPDGDSAEDHPLWSVVERMEADLRQASEFREKVLDLLTWAYDNLNDMPINDRFAKKWCQRFDETFPPQPDRFIHFCMSASPTGHGDE